MVKFRKNKFKSSKKIVTIQETRSGVNSNKILKKKLNAEKKVKFHKKVLLKEAVSESDNFSLVKNVTVNNILSRETLKKAPEKAKTTMDKAQQKHKSVEKHKKRQKTQIKDTKLLLKLMKKK